jgi:hypothetical protein
MTTMYWREFFFAFLLLGIASADTTLVDTKLDYSVYLPNNWIREVTSDSQHFFFDSTYRYPSQLSIRRYAIDTTLYSSADEWTYAHFTAYRLYVQYSVDPAGVIFYYNADSTVRQGSCPAAELYAVFFSSDTSIGAWAEYVRFSAYGRSGYELYAIGDTLDMASHIGFYAAILQGVRFFSADPVAYPRSFYSAVARNQEALSPLVCDPLGRKIRAAMISKYLSSGMYLGKKGVQRLNIR